MVGACLCVFDGTAADHPDRYCTGGLTLKLEASILCSSVNKTDTFIDCASLKQAT